MPMAFGTLSQLVGRDTCGGHDGARRTIRFAPNTARTTNWIDSGWCRVGSPELYWIVRLAPNVTRTDSLLLYLAALVAPWPRETVRSITVAIREAGRFDESIKWGNPYFAIDGRAAVKLFVARDWVNVYFYRGAELSDPSGLLEPGDQKRMRKMRVHRGQAVPGAFVDLVLEARGLELRQRPDS